MKILVNNEIKVLTMVANGNHCETDFIAPTTHNEFLWNEDKEMYEVSQEDFDWWQKVIDDAQIVQDAIDSYQFENLSQAEKDKYYDILFYENDLDIYYEKALIWLKEHKVI